MEDEEVTAERGETTSSNVKTYADVFRESFPFYLSIGMTYEQYWHGDAWLVCDYYDAYVMRRDEQNFFAWLGGAYHYAAVATALSNISLDGKRHKTNNYLDKPFQIRPKTAEEAEAEQREREMKIIKALEGFGNAWKEKHKNA